MRCRTDTKKDWESTPFTTAKLDANLPSWYRVQTNIACGGVLRTWKRPRDIGGMHGVRTAVVGESGFANCEGRIMMPVSR
jgi:hypothetical protein